MRDVILYRDIIIQECCLREKRTGFFTNAAGQEATTSISRERNARISGVIFSRQCFSPEIRYNGFGEEREALYMQQTITAKLQILVLGKYSRGY